MQLVLLVMIILSGVNSFGRNLLQEAEEARLRLRDKQSKLTTQVRQVDFQLKLYGFCPESFVVATNMLAQAANSRAWKELYSGETKTHIKARTLLTDTMKTIEDNLHATTRIITQVKEIKYNEWAKTHPEEAREIEIDKRVSAAESMAANAQMQAQAAQNNAWNASRDAEQAKRDALDAQQRANTAQIQARNAQGRADDAENALRNRGFRTW